VASPNHARGLSELLSHSQPHNLLPSPHQRVTQQSSHASPLQPARSSTNNNEKNVVFPEPWGLPFRVADSHPCFAPQSLHESLWLCVCGYTHVLLHLESEKQHSSHLGASLPSGSLRHVHIHRIYPQPLQTEHPATTLKSNKPQ